SPEGRAVQARRPRCPSWVAGSGERFGRIDGGFSRGAGTLSKLPHGGVPGIMLAGRRNLLTTDPAAYKLGAWPIARETSLGKHKTNDGRNDDASFDGSDDPRGDAVEQRGAGADRRYGQVSRLGRTMAPRPGRRPAALRSQQAQRPRPAGAAHPGSA